MSQPGTNGERLVRIETLLISIRDEQASVARQLFAHSEEDDKRFDSIFAKLNWGYGVGAALLFVLTFFGDAVRAAIFGQ